MSSPREGAPSESPVGQCLQAGGQSAQRHFVRFGQKQHPKQQAKAYAQDEQCEASGSVV